MIHSGESHSPAAPAAEAAGQVGKIKSTARRRLYSGKLTYGQVQGDQVKNIQLFFSLVSQLQVCCRLAGQVLAHSAVLLPRLVV